MSNNKPKSSVTPVNQHLQNKAQPKQSEIIAAANAAEAAKYEAAKAEPKAEPKAPVDAAEDVVVDTESVTDDKSEADKAAKDKPRKRLNRKQWVAILAKKEREGLTAAQIADEHGVSEGNVYQWGSKLRAELDAAAKAADADKLTPSSLVDDAIELMKGITGELESFDSKIAEAKALVDNAAKERKVIEDSRKKYEQIIELLGTDEDKAKAKEVAVAVSGK